MSLEFRHFHLLLKSDKTVKKSCILSLGEKAMSSMVQPIVPLLIVCFSYIVFIGFLAKVRREKLSLQFALESLAITAVLVTLIWITKFSLHPAINLFLLYVITMRVRLLTEVGTFFARQNHFDWANRIYDFAQRAFPDPSSLLLLNLNKAVSLIKQNKLSDAITILEELLTGRKSEYLGTKYEAAAHYNLGVAYLKAGRDALATIELNKAIEVMPLSEYAALAEKALGQRQKPIHKV